MSEKYFDTWKEARTRFTKLLPDLLESDLTNHLDNSPNSIGFLIRHIADVELLFAKNVFGAQNVKVIAKTVIEKKDTGEWTNLEELLAYSNYAEQVLGKIIQEQSNEDWKTEVSTQEFGTKLKTEALGRIISHTAYHTGQLAIILKYGK